MSDILERLVMMTQYQGFYIVDSSAPLFKTEREAVEYLFPEVVAEMVEKAKDEGYSDGWNTGHQDALSDYSLGYDEGYSAARNAFEEG